LICFPFWRLHLPLRNLSYCYWLSFASNNNLCLSRG
jgi:hypothetical protein